MSLKTDVDQLVADAATINDWAHGDASHTTQMGGQPVRSPAKLIADKNAEINVNAQGVLAQATAQANAATASASTATTQAGNSAASAAASDAARAAAVVAQDNAVAVVTGGTAALVAAPAKIPLADSNGLLDVSWLAAIQGVAVNNIGVPGQAGFGVGVCPAAPNGYAPLAGCTNRHSANYGNYQYSEGSIIVWIPAFFMRLGHVDNPTYGAYGVNSVSVVPIGTFPDDATANAEGYYRHRAFINAGADQLGFFRDKYDCSQNGTIASSIANAMPLVSGPAAGQVGFSVCTANGQTPGNFYYGALQAAKSRGNKFFPESAFIADALCRISEAHAQHADSSTYCAWYDGTGVKNYPKGCDNNALSCGVDLTVTFTTAGASSYPNMPLAGSGVPFAKTTHNGQACGCTGVAGDLYKINIGMTCATTTKAITGATQANPVNLTVVAHGYTTGQVKKITGVVGMTQLNDKLFAVTVVDADHITLDGVDGTAFTAYASAGTVTTGIFYTLKPSVDIAALTSGITLSTDHWGTTGIAANFDAVTPNFATTYPNNGYAQRYGNGANAVFDMSTSNGRALAMLGMPAAGGMSVSGTNAMGQDYFYQQMVDQVCVLSRGYWGLGSDAGSRVRPLSYERTRADNVVGFACASYL